jgi:uncharacterized coiled-coil protein SlyX
MAEQRVQYVIELLRQGQGAQQAADDLDKVDKSAAKLSATAGQLRSAFALLAGSVVTRELFQFARESIAAFEAQEKAIQKLDGTLRASGQFTREYSEHLQRLSERFQDVTNVADDVVLGVEAQLIAFGAAGHEIERLTGLVLDLSAAACPVTASCSMRPPPAPRSWRTRSGRSRNASAAWRRRPPSNVADSPRWVSRWVTSRRR